MKKVKYRNNNNYNNQVYSINYKFDSVSPAGKICGTALDLIKKYNELAKEAQANNNYIEAEVFRQYAEHYRKIITEINERKNIRFTTKDNSKNNEDVVETPSCEVNNEKESEEKNDAPVENAISTTTENTLVETKVKSVKKSFKIVEVSDSDVKAKKAVRQKCKKAQTAVVNE